MVRTVDGEAVSVDYRELSFPRVASFFVPPPDLFLSLPSSRPHRRFRPRVGSSLEFGSRGLLLTFFDPLFLQDCSLGGRHEGGRSTRRVLSFRLARSLVDAWITRLRFGSYRLRLLYLLRLPLPLAASS